MFNIHLLNEQRNHKWLVQYWLSREKLGIKYIFSLTVIFVKFEMS